MAGETETKKSNEERIKELQDELRSLMSQAEYLREQIDTINSVIDDLFAALEVLDYMSKEGKGKVVLVPIGAGNFIKARIEDVSTVIMSIGGRLSLETSVEDAKRALDNRIKVLESVRLDLLRKLEEINRKINEILPRVEESVKASP